MKSRIENLFKLFVSRHNTRHSMESDQPVEFRSYFDFDGTLTGVEGNKLWDVEINGKIIPVSVRDNLFHSNDTQPAAYLTKYFNSDWKVPPLALQLLRNQMDSHVNVVIISRNYQAYIQTVLLLSGLEQKYLDKLNIIDRGQLPLGKKGLAIMKYEQAHGGSAKNTSICDDSLNDLADMMSKCGTQSEKKYGHGHAPNQFDWIEIAKDFPLQQEEKKDSRRGCF